MLLLLCPFLRMRKKGGMRPRVQRKPGPVGTCFFGVAAALTLLWVTNCSFTGKCTTTVNV